MPPFAPPATIPLPPSLPRTPQAAKLRVLPCPLEKAATWRMQTSHPIEIAVVDDDIAVLESFQFMLELAGFRVAIYSSGRAFLEQTAHPSCLILDQHMPSMSGLDLTARLRDRGEQLPILLITSAPSPGIIARAAALGVERVLEKPAPEEELINFARRHAA